MQFILLIILVHFSVVNAFSQNTKNFQGQFTLNGWLKGRDTGIIVLWHPDITDTYIKDTVSIKEGKFQFQGLIKEPSYVHLIGSKAKGNYASFYLEPGIQTIYLEENKFEDFILKESFTQKQADTLKTIVKGIFEKYKDWLNESDKILEQYSRATDSLTKLKLDKELKRLNKRNAIVYDSARKETIAFIRNHPDSYVSANYLDSYFSNLQITSDSTQFLFSRFSDRIKNSLNGRTIQEELKKRKGNIKAANFSAADINNKKISLDDFKGTYVLLNFWASWCIPCIKEIPELKMLHTKYASKGFAIITISIDADKQNWIDAVKKYQLEKFRNVLANDEIHQKYSNTKQPIPSMLLINRQGIIIWNSMSPTVSLSEILSKEFNSQ